MIDLTSFNHRRGVWILNSKEVRKTISAAFDWKVHNNCAMTEIRFLKSYLNDEELTPQTIEFMKYHVEALENFIKDNDKCVDTIRETFS